MGTDVREKIAQIAAAFQIPGSYIYAESVRTGHINDTYLSSFQLDRNVDKYIHQRINTKVFTEPIKLMDNMQRVTQHISKKILENGGDPTRNSLSLVPNFKGKFYYVSEDGSFWRTYKYIENTKTYDVPLDSGQVFEAARAYGEFQKLVSTLPGPRLHETIPDFHNTPKRYEKFIQVVGLDPLGRKKDAGNEIQFIVKRVAEIKKIKTLIDNKSIPVKITHNDTKLNNVLFDNQTNKAVCIIDLDTVMPGTILYDFGDMVRTSIPMSEEDEPDLEKVKINLSFFKKLAAGYLESTGEFLSRIELENLAFSGRLITLEQAIRFLTDYLQGDVYYKTKYPKHNLIRTRTQIKLVSEMEKHALVMQSIIDNVYNS